MSERRTRVAGAMSLLPIAYGIGFAIYAFTVGAVSNTVITGDDVFTREETIVEAGGALGVVLAFAPLVLGIFLALLLRIARKDSDSAPLIMAWAFSGFILLMSVITLSQVGRFLLTPAICMLIATGATQFALRAPRNQAT